MPRQCEARRQCQGNARPEGNTKVMRGPNALPRQFARPEGNAKAIRGLMRPAHARTLAPRPPWLGRGEHPTKTIYLTHSGPMPYCSELIYACHGMT